jgi:UDPglucose 6-dehydrogenase
LSDVAVVGLGYVGLTTAAGLAHLGHDVVGLEIDRWRLSILNDGGLPIHEPGLGEMVEEGRSSGRLRFTDSPEAIGPARHAFLAVGTPMDERGAANLRSVRSAAEMVGRHGAPGLNIINKSTVPIGTGDMVEELVREVRDGSDDFAVVSNPEFLREGTAVYDFLHPRRIVFGSRKPHAIDEVAGLFASLAGPRVITDIQTAEMIKYAANAFLATKISFINEIAQICENLGADVTAVAEGMGLDDRIGRAFLDAGIGFGGSCLPKDVSALRAMAQDSGYHPGLLQAVLDINADMRKLVAQRLAAELGTLEGSCIAVLGLAFKPDTDDVREAPSLDAIDELVRAGATVRAYDPAVASRGATALPDDVVLCRDVYEAMRGADAVALLTEWPEFGGIDFELAASLMRGRVIFDGRNMLDPARVREHGFRYRGVGR